MIIVLIHNNCNNTDDVYDHLKVNSRIEPNRNNINKKYNYLSGKLWPGLCLQFNSMQFNSILFIHPNLQEYMEICFGHTLFKYKELI